MPITHKPKGGATLTGTEYEASDSHNNTGTGATSTEAFGDAASDGTGTKLALIDHKHGMPANPVAYAAPALTLGTSNVQGVANSAVRTDATILAFDATTPANVGTAAVGAATVAARRDHVHATGAGTPSTQAIGDAAATGTGPAAAMTDHKHAMPAFGTGPAAVGTQANGSSANIARIDHVHATGAGTPSTQAMGDAAAVGTGPAASMTDHKHAMPSLGFGLTSNSTPAVSLTTASAFATATTSVSAATYADVTGVTVTLASGTWLVTAQCTGSSVNAQAIMHVAITDASNTVLSEGSQGIGASGTASVAQLGTVTVTAIVVATGAAIKMRAARGLTTITGTWTAMNGAGTNTTNNLTDGSNKGTGIFAVRIA